MYAYAIARDLGGLYGKQLLAFGLTALAVRYGWKNRSAIF
jgi:hypothetical protein